MQEQLSLADVVPVLRADLKIGEPQPGRGENEIRVEDVATGKALVIKGFELSLARMLNGRRTAEEVLSSAAQIGLPMSIESLNGFLRKLRKEGFLTDRPASAPLDITTWEARSEWTEEIRRLFQEALREARADRFIAARSRLDALLARSPSIQEAQQLLHWVMERLRPETAHDAPLFSQVFAEAEQGWFAEGELVSAENERAAAQMPSLHVAAPPRSRRNKTIAIGAAAVATFGALLIPLPHTATAPFTLMPRASATVAAAHGGTLSGILVAEGQWVALGAPIARWDAPAAQKKIAAIEARLAEVRKLARPDGAAAKKLREAQAKADKAIAARTKAELELSKLHARGKKTPALSKTEKKLNATQAAVAAAQASVDALTPPPSAAVQATLAREQAALVQARAESEDAAVVAPVDGFVQALNVKPGQVVEAGAVLARLEDTRVLRAVIALPKGETIAAGAAVELKVGPISATGVVEKSDGTSAEAPIDNAKARFKASATGESTFAGASKSLLGRL